MKVISRTYFDYHIASLRALFALLTFAAVVLLTAQAVFMGLSVRAGAANARADARAEVLAIRIAELESRISIKDTVTPLEAEVRGFSAPVSLSYATKHSLGSVLLFGNEL